MLTAFPEEPLPDATVAIDDPRSMARGAVVATLDGFVSAAANAAADPNRSAGVFSSDLATAAATWGGTDFRSVVTAGALSAMIFMMICCAEPPRCGGWPASISNSTLPSE